MIQILSEPRGDDYRRLLTLSAEYCSTFTLVLKRPKVGRGANAKRTEAELLPHSIQEKRVVSWAGTIRPAGSSPARLGVYRFCAKSMELLSKVDGLYDWCLPDLPEDLDLFRHDGRPFLLSTAHEREAMIGAVEISEKRFREIAPNVEYRWVPGERWKL